jgi:hypothetical protein
MYVGALGGVPLKRTDGEITMQEAQAIIAFHPNQKIIDYEMPMPDGTTCHRALATNGDIKNGFNPIIE